MGRFNAHTAKYTRSPFDRAALICPSIGRGTADGDPLQSAITQSTTFARTSIGSNPPHQYSRVSNPTVSTLEQALGGLEDALPAVCFATGLAAEIALFLSVLRAGDHAICGRSVYGGTTRLLQQLLPDLGIECTFVDSTNPETIAEALRPETRLVFLETPANPTLEITDIKACRDAIGRDDVLLAVDNTFLTPVLQQPLELGADISVYSTTKFIDGHSIALGGALVTRNAKLHERFRFIRKCTGAIQTPFNAWLTINGLKTLPLRIREQSRSARIIAEWLSKQPGVSATYYPSLGSAASRKIADRQHLGADGAVVTFEIAGGLEPAKAFAESLELCTLVEHVGSVETLLTHPATMTHADVPRTQRLAVGITDGLLRLSVGLEPVEALIADLEAGLASASALTTEAKETESCAAIA